MYICHTYPEVKEEERIREEEEEEDKNSRLLPKYWHEAPAKAVDYLNKPCQIQLTSLC